MDKAGIGALVLGGPEVPRIRADTIVSASPEW